jgi:WD40 repeat protein
VHQANITCLVFLPEHIVSASHDKILIWDLKQREVLKTIQRDDQFWVMAKHPETNQVAAGHDSGVIIIKAERETCLCC